MTLQRRESFYGRTTKKSFSFIHSTPFTTKIWQLVYTMKPRCKRKKPDIQLIKLVRLLVTVSFATYYFAVA
ncbi:hypothetical protein DXT99_04105 [Pontibacter diazotrophicus]|uniref:Transmembrane protein n=1 Tax=Pontibacter diazotrophicus TaxID=1400979 RepID=A0A3D8LG59_9BACT|nr:hypothetical protein DXT99_04105 [Pontibacter diazotrophicus]